MAAKASKQCPPVKPFPHALQEVLAILVWRLQHSSSTQHRHRPGAECWSHKRMLAWPHIAFVAHCQSFSKSVMPGGCIRDTSGTGCMISHPGRFKRAAHLQGLLYNGFQLVPGELALQVQLLSAIFVIVTLRAQVNWPCCSGGTDTCAGPHMHLQQ